MSTAQNYLILSVNKQNLDPRKHAVDVIAFWIQYWVLPAEQPSVFSFKQEVQIGLEGLSKSVTY